MLRESGFHRGRDAKRLVNTNEVVVHVEQSDGMGVIFNLFAEGIRQPREPADVHPHREILPLHVRRADVLRVRVARNRHLHAAFACGRAIAGIRLDAAVNLHKHRVVDVTPEGIFDGRQVHLLPVRRQLNPIGQAISHILQEGRRATGIAQADQPAQDELRLCINRDERPDIAHRATRGIGGGDVPLLRANERPYFIHLDALRGHVADGCVLVSGARGPDIREQAQNRPLRHARQTRRGPDRAALDQSRNDGNLLGNRQAVHNGPIILYRFSMSSGKRRGHSEILGGGLLFLRPTGLCGLFGDLTAAAVRKGFQAAFPANPAPLAAHLGHDLRDHRPGGFSRFLGGICGSYGLQNNSPGILDGVELGCASALKHALSSPRRWGFVKLEGISN